MPIVDRAYIPNARMLINLEKEGYKKKQMRILWDKFTSKSGFGGKEFANIDDKFRDVIRREPAHSIKKPDNAAGDALDKKRANDIANRSEDSHEKAEAAHSVNNETSQEYAKNWIDKQRGLK
jgi:hypothetical protein